MENWASFDVSTNHYWNGKAITSHVSASVVRIACLIGMSCRSCVSYSPNSQFILASSLDNTHRLFPSQLYDQSLGTGTWTKIDALRSYTGHVNSRYSVFSTLYSNVYGNYVLSGSEDNKVSVLTASLVFLIDTFSGVYVEFG